MEEQTTIAEGSKKNKTVLYATIAIVLLLALGAGYLFMTNGANLIGGNSETANEDEAVATVNGEPITRRAYNNATAQLASAAEAQGVTLTEAQIHDQALNSLINNRLLVQEANASGATATEAEVTSEYDLVVGGAGGADAFNAQLATLNLTEAEVRTELAEQLAVNKYLLSAINSETAVTVTDEEVDAFYANITAAGGEVPALADIRSQIEEQIRFQKQQQLVAEVIEGLRANASIEILI